MNAADLLSTDDDGPSDVLLEAEEGRDPLMSLNAELREQQPEDEDPDSPWLPLESNPEVFTDFAHKVGLPDDWEWVDIFGLDPELLQMIPTPCAGVILLFPCTEPMFEARKTQQRQLLHLKRTNTASPASQQAYHVHQVAEFGNACGTIASVHALINGAWVYDGKGGALHEFCQGHQNDSPQARGKALLQTSALRSTSDQSASHSAAQTSCPDRNGPDLDHHFVAFAPILDNNSNSRPRRGGLMDEQATHVVELDGTKVIPVDHGSIAEILERDDAEETKELKHRRFLRAVAKVIQERYMQLDPDNIEFTMMALCKKPPKQDD